MAKEKYTLTGLRCPVTDAPLATMPVKVKEKMCQGTKRVFDNVEQLGGLTDEYLLKCVNYAEDLFCRNKTTSDNTDNTGKAAKRLAAREHWKLNDKLSFIVFFLDEVHTDKEIDSRLDAYYEENLAVGE